MQGPAGTLAYHPVREMNSGLEGFTQDESMKAIVYYQNGSPDVLRLAEIEKPRCGSGEVLIKVCAAAVNPLDCGSLQGLPYLLGTVFGVRPPAPSHPGRCGVDFAGLVEGVGRDVAQFKPGDEVFGVCVNNPQARRAKAWVHDQGAFAEYVSVPESAVVLKPANVTFEQAASAPVAGLTALQGLRDKGRIRPGRRVLINGAAGGVGTFAVQIAKSFGAEVTAVCSTVNVERVRLAGADRVIDYTREDFTETGEHYDVIFDCVANHSLTACRKVMNDRGRLIMAGQLGSRLGVAGFLARLAAACILSFSSNRKTVTFLAVPKKEDLAILRDLLQAGKLVPVIDRCYRLSEAADALRYLMQKHARGKIVISVSTDAPHHS